MIKCLSLRHINILTPIQASGRTSRLYAGGISKGLSVVLVDDKATFESLKKKLLWLGDIKFENIKDVDIQSILKAIDQDRENLRAFIKKRKGTRSKRCNKAYFGNSGVPHKSKNNIFIFWKAS